ncbi:MAG TPA: anti-sigma factor [Pyrinomonadaceae bacterium]|nr:anti-sigma factor [Pyrinomonadaceae bacterium]
MKCEECTTNALEEFLDGELDARRAAETEAHLAACQRCAAAYERLLDEQNVYAAYERDVQVTPQMWAGVATRIAVEAEPQREANIIRRVRAWLAEVFVAPRFSPVFTAALMLLAIGATAGVMKYLNPQTGMPAVIADGRSATATPEQRNVAQQPAPETTPSAEPSKPQTGTPVVVANGQPDEGEKSQKAAPQQRRRDAERKFAQPANDPAQVLAAALNGEQIRRQRATARLVSEAESKYVAAIKMLSEDVNRKRTRLDPQVAARFDETLATIDRSIAETRRTVLKHGNDPVAVQYMLSAYAKKVEVMREMAALD